MGVQKNVRKFRQNQPETVQRDKASKSRNRWNWNEKEIKNPEGFGEEEEDSEN